MDNAVAYLTAGELIAAYEAKTLSPLEALDEALARIERFEPEFNAFQHLDPEAARVSAEASGARWARGAPQGALDGVPLTIKDLTPVKG